MSEAPRAPGAASALLDTSTPPFRPSVRWLDALESQASVEVFERLLRYATPPPQRTSAVEAAARAREVVQTAFGKALDGSHFWTPTSGSLESHLITSIRWRASQDRRYAEELTSHLDEEPPLSATLDVDDTAEMPPVAPPLTSRELHERLHALRLVVPSDQTILELLEDAIRHDEAMERMAQLSTEASREAARSTWQWAGAQLAELRGSGGGVAAGGDEPARGTSDARISGEWELPLYPESPKRADLHAILEITRATRGYLLDLRRTLAARQR